MTNEELERMKDQEEANAIRAYYEMGDEKAEAILFEKNFKIIESVIANRFKVPKNMMDEVIADGRIFLHNAIKSYKLSNTQKFHLNLYCKVYRGLNELYPEYNTFKPQKKTKNREIFVDNGDDSAWETDTINSIFVKEMYDKIRKLLCNVKPRYQKIFELKYGLADGKTRTNGEVAQIMDCSGERIRTICEKVLQYIRKELREKYHVTGVEIE